MSGLTAFLLAAATLGVVRDDSCAPLGGVAVVAFDADGRRIAETTTDTAGAFRLAVSGTRLRFELFGFESIERLPASEQRPEVRLPLAPLPAARNQSSAQANGTCDAATTPAAAAEPAR